MVGAIFIQIGTNLSNDYSDARRGADTEDRLGPVRSLPAGSSRRDRYCGATYLTFGVAVLAGVYLIAVAGWELLLIGVGVDRGPGCCTRADRKPYGYEGLGEVFVFLFFGIVAVAGSFFVQVQVSSTGRHLPWRCRSD